MGGEGTQQQLLRDPGIYPSKEVLASIMGENFQVYTAFIQKLPDLGIDFTWQYYNDGKSWLAKGISKKKTVFWLSIWELSFRITFFFTEKTRTGIQGLPIDDRIKATIVCELARGKLIPLILDMSVVALSDAFALITYKQSV